LAGPNGEKRITAMEQRGRMKVHTSQIERDHTGRDGASFCHLSGLWAHVCSKEQPASVAALFEALRHIVEQECGNFVGDQRRKVSCRQ
jgi:hypothetical protein